MLGSRSLFSNILVTEEVTAAPTRGRSPELDALRNELLCARYYFYITFYPERSYDSTIDKLSDEFFLRHKTIVDVLRANLSLIRYHRDQQTSRSALQKKYAHFNWSI